MRIAPGTNGTPRIARRQLREQGQRWRDNVIDADIVVDDARRDADAAVERLGRAVFERDRAAVRLRLLIELASSREAARG